MALSFICVLVAVFSGAGPRAGAQKARGDMEVDKDKQKAKDNDKTTGAKSPEAKPATDKAQVAVRQPPSFVFFLHVFF